MRDRNRETEREEERMKVIQATGSCKVFLYLHIQSFCNLYNRVLGITLVKCYFVWSFKKRFKHLLMSTRCVVKHNKTEEAKLSKIISNNPL